MAVHGAEGERGQARAWAARHGPADVPPRRNGLLAALAEEDQRRLAPELEPVALAPGQTLFTPGEPITHVHFPAGAVLSLVVAMADGRAAEAATVGREGAVGVVAGGVARGAFTRAAVQVPGPALRIASGRLEAVRAASPALNDLLGRYADALLAQVLQSVACNVLHPVEARCARWLLMTLDRVGGEAVPLTQEHLAEMLGVHRVTVADTLRGLEAAGVVRRERLRVRVLDRPGLERRACECYAAVRAHFRRMLPPAGASEAGRRADAG